MALKCNTHIGPAAVEVGLVKNENDHLVKGEGKQC